MSETKIECLQKIDSIDDPWVLTLCREPAPYTCAECGKPICHEHSTKDPISEERFCSEPCS